MPNWVANKLVLTGKDANRVADMLMTINKENGKEFVDFNNIDRMPETLNCVCGSCTAPAADYYLSSINPDCLEVEGDKISTKEFDELLTKVNECNYLYGEPLLSGKNKYGVEAADFKTIGSKDKYLAYGKQIVDNRINYKASTWYEWSRAHWGVKWNASSSWIDRGLNEATIYFETPWQDVRRLMRRFITEKCKDLGLKVDARYDYSEEEYGYYEGYDVYKDGVYTNSKQYAEDGKAAKKHWHDTWGY